MNDVLIIESERAEQLARELAALTGESITDAVVVALENRLQVEQRRRQQQRAAIDDIVQRFSRLPVLDPRSVDEILAEHYAETDHPSALD